MSEPFHFKRSRSASGSLSPRAAAPPRLETSPSADASLETRINVRPDGVLHQPLSQREAPRPHSHNGAVTSSPRGFAVSALTSSASSTALNTRPPSPGPSRSASRRGSLIGLASSPSHTTHLPSISSMLPPIDIRRPRSANFSRGGSPSGAMRPFGEGSSRPGLSYYASAGASAVPSSGPLQPEFHRHRSMVDFPPLASSVDESSSFAAYSAPYRAKAPSTGSFGTEESGSNTPARASSASLPGPPPPLPPQSTSLPATSRTAYEGYDDRDAKRPRLPDPSSFSSSSHSAGPFPASMDSSSSSGLGLRRGSSARSPPPPPDDYGSFDESAREEGGRSGRVLKRTYQACIRCRTKKLKCDSRLPRCTPCANAGTECQQADVRRQTSYPRGYVENLEEMCQVQEQLLRRLLPNVPPSEYKALAADESRWRPGSDRPIERR